MKTLLLSSLLLFFTNHMASANDDLRFSIIKTSTLSSREALVFQGGDISKKVKLNHSAFLIQKGDEYFLFDTALGSDIDQQYEADMPFWGKPFFSYGEVRPAINQIPQNIVKKIKDVFLSHIHWDHASGLSDFKSACVVLPHAEMDEYYEGKEGAIFSSQLAHRIKWCPFYWIKKTYKGFTKSYSIFKDDSAVLVPLPGHTYGSVGLFLKTKDKEYFLVGDLTWSLRALKANRSKFLGASLVVDREKKKLLRKQ